MRGNRALRLIDRWIGTALILLFGLVEKLRACVRVRRCTPLDFDRILVLKLAALGDTILLLPTIDAIKRAHPSCHLTMVITLINAEGIERAESVDEIVRIHGQDLLNPLRAYALIRRLRRHRYTLALDFEQWSHLTPLVLYLSGARTRAGFRVRGWVRHLLFTEPVAYKADLHEAECFGRIARHLGLPPASAPPELNVHDEDREEIRRMLTEHGVNPEAPLVAIHPGCGTHGERRQWPEERYARIADRLVRHYGATVVLTGGRSERGLADRLARRMEETPVTTSGRLSFWPFAALLSLCDLLICGNTGAMHAAAAVSTPAVALHGPTDPVKWGPLGESHIVLKSTLMCSPCLRFGYDYRCGENRCMRAISEEEVWRAVRTLMDRPGRDESRPYGTSPGA